MNRVFLPAFLTVVCPLVGFALAQSHPDGWVIGVTDGAGLAHNGALEYLSVDQTTFFAGGMPSPDEQLAQGWRFVEFDYQVTGPTDENPAMPGYIGPENVCVFSTSDNRPCTVTTMVLRIHFTLLCDYQTGELNFVMGRYGSESDDVLIDNFPVGLPVDAILENNYAELTFELPGSLPGGVLTAGDHMITIAYRPGTGMDNGHYIDALALLPLRESCLVEDGFMTGGGSVVQNSRVTHGFELHCNPADGPNHLQVNWGGRGWTGSDGFHLESLDWAECVDSLLEQAPPGAGFDTYSGFGWGRFNGESGYQAWWRFTDAGQPGRNDTAEIQITAPDGAIVFHVSGNLQRGNHQAH